MIKAVSFDVLVVYNQKLATTASDPNVVCPFSRYACNQSYNAVYAYFLTTCKKFNLQAAFSTSADIIGAGLCKSFWQFKNNHWLKTTSPCYSKLIFDKFSPTSATSKLQRHLLLSRPEVKAFNDSSLFDIFFDKQATYDTLPGFAIPTVALKTKTLTGITRAIKKLSHLVSSHPGFLDFDQSIIIKDRFGAGGRRIYKFKIDQIPDILATISQHPRVSFIFQPFIKFDQGFSYQKCPASTDIRLVYLNGQIVQFYIRVARLGEFRCNEHRGGLLTYLSLKDIPPALALKSNLIAANLGKINSLFSLDFIISNLGNIYLLEGNTGPGLDWNTALAKNETESKKLIKLVIRQLAQTLEARSSSWQADLEISNTFPVHQQKPT